MPHTMAHTWYCVHRPPTIVVVWRDRVVGMVSHLDTVYPREQLQRDRFAWQDDSASTDRLLGPGTMDIKGGTILICMILDALPRS